MRVKIHGMRASNMVLRSLYDASKAFYRIKTVFDPKIKTSNMILRTIRSVYDASNAFSRTTTVFEAVFDPKTKTSNMVVRSVYDASKAF